MGIIYTVSLASSDAKAWLLEQGIVCSNRPSRWPTGAELKQAVECISDINATYNDNGLGRCWQALLSNGESDDREIWAALNVDEYLGDDQENKFWFDKGTTELNVAIALGALAVNLTCALVLTQFRKHSGSLTRAAFLSARNDAFANVAIVATGLLTTYWASGWPDLVVGLAIAAVNADAAKEVWEAAREERRQAEA